MIPNSIIHKARRSHRCAKCQEPIASGLSYVRAAPPATRRLTPVAFHVECYREELVDAGVVEPERASTHGADFDAGRKAAERGDDARSSPFAFGRLGVTQEQFERFYHHRLNAWMEGWNSLQPSSDAARSQGGEEGKGG